MSIWSLSYACCPLSGYSPYWTEKESENIKHILSIAALALFSCAQALVAEPLLKSGTFWDGGAIVYPEGKAEITSIIK
jgi:hypothetical protein